MAVAPVVLCMVVGKCSNFVRVLFVHLMVVAILCLVGEGPTLYGYLFVWLLSLHLVATASLALFELTSTLFVCHNGKLFDSPLT